MRVSAAGAIFPGPYRRFPLDEARNFAVLIDINPNRPGFLWQSRHQHHVAGDGDQKFRAGGKRKVSDVQCPARRGARKSRLVGEGVLRFRDADCQVSEAPFAKLRQFLPRLLAELHAGRPVDLARHLTYLRFDIVRGAVGGSGYDVGIGVEHTHHGFRQIRRARGTFRKSL